MATSDPVERERVVVKLVRMERTTRSAELEYRDRRILGATYVAVVEDALLRHLEGTIQVRGNIRYDDAGEAVSIADVDEVAEVDESPMEVEEVVYRDVRHVATPPLRFDVTFHRSDAFYELQGPFGILLSADSREDLADALEGELKMLFGEYAERDPGNMTSDARKLRDQIRTRFGL